MNANTGGRLAARSRRFMVVALAAAALLFSGALAACTPGGDIEVTHAGGTGGGPSGDVRLNFVNIGDQPLTGTTTVVAEVTHGEVRLVGASLICPWCAPGQGPGISITNRVFSPDGHRMEVTLEGTIPSPDRAVRLLVNYNGADWRNPGGWTVTFSHPGDVNPANNVHEVSWNGF